MFERVRQLFARPAATPELEIAAAEHPETDEAQAGTVELSPEYEHEGATAKPAESDLSPVEAGAAVQDPAPDERPNLEEAAAMVAQLPDRVQLLIDARQGYAFEFARARAIVKHAPRGSRDKSGRGRLEQVLGKELATSDKLLGQAGFPFDDALMREGTGHLMLLQEQALTFRSCAERVIRANAHTLNTKPELDPAFHGLQPLTDNEALSYFDLHNQLAGQPDEARSGQLIEQMRDLRSRPIKPIQELENAQHSQSSAAHEL